MDDHDEGAAAAASTLPEAPTPLPAQLAQDMESTVAWTMIEEGLKVGKLTEEQAADLKARYKALRERVAAVHEKEKGLLKGARRQQNELLGERIKLERAQERLEAERDGIEKHESERERVAKELDELEQRDTVHKYELNELKRNHDELSKQVEHVKAENDKLVLPELSRLEKEVVRGGGGGAAATTTTTLRLLPHPAQPPPLTHPSLSPGPAHRPVLQGRGGVHQRHGAQAAAGDAGGRA